MERSIDTSRNCGTVKCWHLGFGKLSAWNNFPSPRLLYHHALGSTCMSIAKTGYPVPYPLSKDFDPLRRGSGLVPRFSPLELHPLQTHTEHLLDFSPAGGKSYRNVSKANADLYPMSFLLNSPLASFLGSEYSRTF